MWQTGDRGHKDKVEMWHEVTLRRDCVDRVNPLACLRRHAQFISIVYVSKLGRICRGGRSIWGNPNSYGECRELSHTCCPMFTNERIHDMGIFASVPDAACMRKVMYKEIHNK